MDPRFHRADLDAGHERDLLIREPFDVAQEERGALLRGDAAQRLLHDRERLAPGGELREVGTRRHGLGPADVLVRRRVERELGTPSPGAHAIERPVRHDAKQPGAEVRSLERAHRLPRGDERVLHHVLGVRSGPDDARRVAIERTLLSQREPLEGVPVAAARACHKVRLRVSRVVRSHASVRFPVDCASVEQRKKVIVIGEDDEPIARLLRDAINDEPAYQAVIVPDGALVLETVRQVKADLLILDIMMPGLNGLEVYDRVRADTDVHAMPVLFVTAASKVYEKQFADRKIADIITKPFDLNDLLAKVRALCPA